MVEQPLVLGLDVGTQSLRAALVDCNGRTVAFGVNPIATTHERPTWAE
jgi:sugar (pentulose or hexulose) kinase